MPAQFNHTKRFIVFYTLLLFSSFAIGQQSSKGYWKTKVSATKSVKIQLKSNAKSPSYFILNEELFLSELKSLDRLKTGKIIVEFPDSNGEFKQYQIQETSSFSTVLKKKYPSILSFTGKEVNNSNKHVNFTFSKFTGLQATIGEGSDSVKLTKIDEESTYQLYHASDIQRSEEESLQCEIKEDYFLHRKENHRKHNHKSVAHSKKKSVEKKATGEIISFRLALGVSGELSQSILQGLNISSSETDQIKKEAVLSWLNVILQNTNRIFQRDVGIQFELIDSNDDIIFLDPNTDGLSSLDNSTALETFPRILESTINSPTYDLSHFLHLGGGGVATYFGVCDGKTFAAVTGMQYRLDPYIGTFTHEIGHQFTAAHTFNNCPAYQEQSVSSSAVEPGSGSTIMSYNGLCNPVNVPGGELLYFHNHSILQMKNYVESLACGIAHQNDNSIPIVNAGQDYVIPASTPFLLEGEASNPDKNTLTFTWSQMDAATTAAPPEANSIKGPLFRWLPPTSSKQRYFPKLKTILQGNLSNTWEVLPSVSRVLNFDFRVRDNATNMETTTNDGMKITVVETSTPFQIRSQNEEETWYVGSKRIIQWEVGQTASTPINTPKVDLFFSTDNGENFTLLAEGIPNTGEYILAIPFGLATTAGRIMLKGHDNIFLDINNAPIRIIETDFYAEVETPSID